MQRCFVNNGFHRSWYTLELTLSKINPFGKHVSDISKVGFLTKIFI